MGTGTVVFVYVLFKKKIGGASRSQEKSQLPPVDDEGADPADSTR